MIVLESCKILKNTRIEAFTLYPFIFLRKKKSDYHHMYLSITLNHERIHLNQQIELLIIPFFILYLFNFIINIFVYRNLRKSYKSIIFEKESYMYEKDLDYLKRRQIYSFIRMLW